MADPVNPPHYKTHPSGVECIDVVEHMNFNLGNTVKYIWRAGLKGDALEDLKKARWYLTRELERVGGDITEWLPMSAAPTDGTVIDAVGRYRDATAGMPMYVHFLDGEWRIPGRDIGDPMVCWAWRPRTSWPAEPRDAAP